MQRKKSQAVSNFVYLIVLLVVLIFFITFSFYKSNEASDWISHTWNVKNEAHKLENVLMNAEIGQRGYLITLDDEYLEPYELALEEYKVVFVNLKSLIYDNDKQLKRLEKLDSIATLKFAEQLKIITLVEQGESIDALEIVKTDIGETYMDLMRGLVDTIVYEENLLLQERLEIFDRWKVLVLIVIIAAILLTILSAFMLFSKVKPLIESLIETQDKLLQTNDELKVSLNETKEINTLKELVILENDNLIESLKTKNEQLDHFAYVASHDLQEPLRTVSNYLEVFQEDYEDKIDEDTEKYFNFINEAVDRMRNLIAGLLTFSRLGTSGEIEKVDLNEALKEVKNGFESRIEELNATITSEELPIIDGYKIELTQLLQNLISNALKFRKEDVNPVISLNFEEKENYYLFTLKDNGIGIKEKHLTKIFDMFSRLHSTHNYEGQGIGLAFCKKIIELHQGRIWVTSEIDKGTSFHFTIKKKL